MMLGVEPGKEGVLPRKKLAWSALAAFLLALAFSVTAVVFVVTNRLDIEQLTMEQIILEKSNIANETLLRLLYKTQTLAAFSQTAYDSNRGDFEKIAATLNDDPAILNMLIAPNGVVSEVYPLEGNEAVVGLDFFSEGAGNKEAIMAKETGQLVLGGPFDAVQGSQVIVGRMPVYAERPEGGREFWGLVSVTLKYPDVLDAAGLNELRAQGFDYEIWRINPDDGQRQVIAGNRSGSRKPRYLEREIVIQNAEWVFRVYPVRMWYEYPDIWALLLIGLGISALIALVIQNNFDLKQLKDSFETLSHVDPLTGIFNRRYFMECAQTHLDRSERLDSRSAVIMMDIDHFKRVNDKYGHLAGDQALRDIAEIVKAVLRPYDLLGRYGGEEFIVLASDITRADARLLAERMRLAISACPVKCADEDVTITLSLGVAGISGAADLQQVIERADEALYAAKGGGRNRVVLYEDIRQ